jgi:hypothetical protein
MGDSGKSRKIAHLSADTVRNAEMTGTCENAGFSTFNQ